MVIGNKLLDTLNKSDDPNDTCLVIIADNSIKTLVTIFAAILFNIPVRIIQHDADLTSSSLGNMIAKANPFAIVVSNSNIFDNVSLEKYAPNLRLVLYTGEKLNDTLSKFVEVFSWDAFLIQGNSNPQEHWLFEFPKPEIEKPIIGVVFMQKTSGAPMHNPTPSVSLFTNNQIMTSILSQRAFLPKKVQWTQDDKVLIFTASCNMYTLIYQLAALVEGASLAFIEGQDVSFHATMKYLKPTILVCDDFTSWLLSTFTKSLGIFSGVTYVKSMSYLNRGTLRPRAALSLFESVRMIYTYKMICPHIQYQFESEKGQDMDQKACNSLRALTGAPVIHGLASPMVAGPICQTTIGDYRTVHGPSDLGTHGNGDSIAKTCNFVNLGPPMVSLEFNVSDYPGSHLAGSYNVGMLQVRGNAVCDQPDSWVDTGILVVIGTDGCVKLMLKKLAYPPHREQARAFQKQSAFLAR